MKKKAICFSIALIAASSAHADERQTNSAYSVAGQISTARLSTDTGWAAAGDNTYTRKVGAATETIVLHEEARVQAIDLISEQLADLDKEDSRSTIRQLELEADLDALLQGRIAQPKTASGTEPLQQLCNAGFAKFSYNQYWVGPFNPIMSTETTYSDFTPVLPATFRSRAVASLIVGGTTYTNSDIDNYGATWYPQGSNASTGSPWTGLCEAEGTGYIILDALNGCFDVALFSVSIDQAECSS